MFEIWLRTNTRILWVFILPIGMAVLIGLSIILGPTRWHEHGWVLPTGWVVLLVSVWLLCAAIWQIKQPRLARVGHELWIYFRPGRPTRVPLEIVEGFLLGQGPSFLPGKRYSRAEATMLVIRLAERAKEWERRQVSPTLGSWCNHYVTLRGTWCERLDIELVNRLNARLAEAKNQQHAGKVKS